MCVLSELECRYNQWSVYESGRGQVYPFAKWRMRFWHYTWTIESGKMRFRKMMEIKVVHISLLHVSFYVPADCAKEWAVNTSKSHESFPTKTLVAVSTRILRLYPHAVVNTKRLYRPFPTGSDVMVRRWNGTKPEGVCIFHALHALIGLWNSLLGTRRLATNDAAAICRL